MAHGTRINGAAYGTTGGKCLVDGTAYGIKKGRTLVNGTGYDIFFGGPTKIQVTRGTGNKRNCYFTINGDASTPYYEYDTVLNFGAGERVVMNAHVGLRRHVITVDGVEDTENSSLDIDCTGYNVTVKFNYQPTAQYSNVEVTRNK